MMMYFFIAKNKTSLILWFEAIQHFAMTGDPQGSSETCNTVDTFSRN